MSRPTSRQIEAQAASWLARRDAPSWAPADEAALEAWLLESTAHKVAFIRLEAAWAASQKLKALGAGVPKGVIPAAGLWRRSRVFRRRRGSPIEPPPAVLGPRTELPRRRGRWALYGLAASLLVAALIGGAWFLLPPQGSVYRTAVGGLESVPLRDGSKVTLNTDTDVRIDLSPRERRVDLKHGEAFFEVAHDASRPFVVLAGARRVVAVGTKFSVRRDGDQVWVVVTEGTVRLEDRRARSAGGPAQSQSLSSSGSAPSLPPSRTGFDPSADSADVVLLPAGSVAHAEDAGVLVRQESAAEAETALSWREGYVVLHDTPIAQAAAEFNRYNTRKIVVQDPEVGEIRIGGNFRATSTDAFVRLLADGFPIRVDEREDEIVLTKK